MNAKSRWLTLVAVLSLVLTLSMPVVSVQAAAPVLPGNIAVSQTYINTLTYWYKQLYPQDWEARLTAALSPARGQTKSTPINQAVILTGVPANAWWVNVNRQELNGAWNGQPALHPAGVAPGPVHTDLMIQGSLPGIYVLRACEKSGSALINGPRLLVVMPGGTQTFDLPTLPAPPPDQAASIGL
jgi:hypothetical protein